MSVARSGGWLGSGSVQRYLPIAYFVAAMGLVAVLLPTSLRPPPEDPTSSAEFSPDAPPEDNPESIIQSLSRGSSATAGTGEGAGTSEPAAAPEDLPPRACPRGFGNPPRQTESVYAPPCAPAFTADNGGRTHRGVSSTEVRVHVQGSLGNQPGREGCYPDEGQIGESAVDRTIRTLQIYFNQTYQFWGRRVRFCAVVPGSGEAEQRAAASEAADQHDTFAGFAGWDFCDEFARRTLVCYTAQMPQEWFSARQPFTYAYFMDGTKLVRFAAEYICKKLAGKAAAFAGDPLLTGTKRKFGMLYVDQEEYRPIFPLLVKLVSESCATEIRAISYSADAGTGQSEVTTAVTRMRSDGVTTIIQMNDFLSNSIATNVAQGIGYLPEWFTVGFGLTDRNNIARLQNQAQWAHSFGITALDAERPREQTDCYSAYRQVDTSTEPSAATCSYLFPVLQQMVAGIQEAGPDLNPQSFQRGLHDIGYRFYEDPVWAIGGGYGPGDYSFTDNVAEIWWDAGALDPVDGQSRGAYRYVRNGKRYRLGAIPTGDPLAFRDGVTTPSN